eukprot:m51a1_g6388 putative trafficking protein particle complex subunit 6b-like (288) ;mRNA; r:197602-198562
MSASSAQGSQVSEACFEYLLAEFVAYAHQRHAGKPEQAAALLESVGFSIGERLCERLTKDRARFPTPLEAVKFFSRELWTVIFKKILDNLKTNHRGMFVLCENKFRWLWRASMPRDFWDKQAFVSSSAALSTGSLTPQQSSTPGAMLSPQQFSNLSVSTPPASSAPSPGLGQPPQISVSGVVVQSPPVPPAPSPAAASQATPGLQASAPAAAASVPSPTPSPLAPTAVPIDPDTQSAYTALFCGILRGSLSSVGISGTVTVEVNLPQCAQTSSPPPSLAVVLLFWVA